MLSCRGRRAALVLVLALALTFVESAEKPLDAEVKLVGSAVDALTTEIEGIKAKYTAPPHHQSHPPTCDLFCRLRGGT